ncbi:MAG: methyltransferase domain-containing protein [Xanthomonadales bacterium]|nr:methyltransferase domain-containing protein [Xanthomonadales bacterium]
MQLAPDSVFALAPLQRLLDDEWSLAMQRAERLAGGPLLSIAPCVSASRSLPASRPGSCSLHVAGNALSGAASCGPAQLPWPAASFDLVIVRHALDALPAECGLEAELVRVLAPGGHLLLSGFNRFSPWRLWMAGRAEPGRPVPRSAGIAQAADVLQARGLDVIGRDFLGGHWPRAAAHAHVRSSRWQAAWLLSARRQAVAMRVIPIAAARSRAQGVAALVPSSSGRQRA